MAENASLFSLPQSPGILLRSKTTVPTRCPQCRTTLRGAQSRNLDRQCLDQLLNAHPHGCASTCAMSHGPSILSLYRCTRSNQRGHATVTRTTVPTYAVNRVGCRRNSSSPVGRTMAEVTDACRSKLCLFTSRLPAGAGGRQPEQESSCQRGSGVSAST